MSARTQSSNSLDVAVTSATASTIEATGLGAYVGFHLAIVSSTNGSEGQFRYAYASAGRTDVLKVSPEFDTVPAVNDDLSVAKNQDNYNTDYGNDWKLVLKATQEWDVGATSHDIGDGTDHMVGGLTGQGMSQDNYITVLNGSYFGVGYLFGETSLGGWYWNSNDAQSTLGYQFIQVQSSATSYFTNTNFGTVYAHAAFFAVDSYNYFYDASFTNLMYDGFRLKGNVFGTNLKLQGTGISNDYAVVASTISTFDGPIILSDSYGFQSSATDENIRIKKYNSVNALQDIEANNSTTWEFINPVWPNPQILWTQSTGESTVTEIFTIDAEVQTTAGAAIASAIFMITEGSTAVRATINKNTATANGIVSDEITSRYWASTTASTTYGPFTARTWKYTYNPFEGALTVDEALNVTIAMGDDSEIIETEASALLYTDIKVFAHATALTAVAYASGTILFTTSAVVSGSVSGAEGVVREYIGDSTSGTVVLISRNGTSFSNDEDLYITGTRHAQANVSSFAEDYTYEIFGNTNPMTAIYDHQMARFADTSAVVSAWVSTARQRSIRLMDSVGAAYSTEAYFSTGCWVSKRGTGTLNYLTSDSGTQYVPPVSYSFELTGLQTGTEVRIYNSGTGVEIDGVESSGASYTYNYVYGGSDINIFVVIFHLDYVDIRLTTGLALSNSDSSIPIQQRSDRIYGNP